MPATVPTLVFPIDYYQRVAGLNDARLWESSDWPVVLIPEHDTGGAIMYYHPSQHNWLSSLADAFTNCALDAVVFQSGLVLPLPRVPMVWHVGPGAYMYGTAAQADRFAQDLDLSPWEIVPVGEEQLHGWQVREETGNSRFPYRFVPINPFPAWTGVQ